jgi:hypothetical protein
MVYSAKKKALIEKMQSKHTLIKYHKTVVQQTLICKLMFNIMVFILHIYGIFMTSACHTDVKPEIQTKAITFDMSYRYQFD